MRKLFAFFALLAVIAGVSSAAAEACIDPYRGNIAGGYGSRTNAYRLTPSNNLSVYATFQNITSAMYIRDCTNNTGVDLGEVGWEGNSGSLRLAAHYDCWDSAPWNRSIVGYYTSGGGEIGFFVVPWDGASAVSLEIDRSFGTQDYYYYVNGVQKGVLYNAPGRNGAQFIGAQTHYHTPSTPCTSFKTRISNMAFNTGWADAGDVWHRIVAPYTYVGAVSTTLP